MKIAFRNKLGLNKKNALKIIKDKVSLLENRIEDFIDFTNNHSKKGKVNAAFVVEALGQIKEGIVILKKDTGL